MGLLLLLASCSPVRAYPGPTHPREATAVFVASALGGNLGSLGYPGDGRFPARIQSIDERPWRPASNVAELLPGRPVIVLDWTRSAIPFTPPLAALDVASSFSRPTGRGTAALPLDVAAGHSWELAWNEEGGTDMPLQVVDVTE